MRTAIRIVPALVVLGIVSALSGSAEAARFIAVTVSLDGKPILEGAMYDDGRPDADGVWETLKGLRLKPTRSFAQLDLERADQSFVLNTKVPGGRPGRIVVHVRYGGRAETSTLRLTRTPAERGGFLWSVHADDVDRLFGERLITRDQARGLREPKLSKP